MGSGVAFGRVARIVAAAAFVGFWACAGASLAADAPKPAPPAKDAAKATVKLKAKSIVFDHATGDVQLEGDVCVTRTTGDEVLTVFCDKMTAKMKDGKIENVQATGSVRLNTAQYSGTALRAAFDFGNNIVTLYGDDNTPATVTSEGMTSTGQTIKYHMTEQRVELGPGDTGIDVKKAPPDTTPKPKSDKPAAGKNAEVPAPDTDPTEPGN